VSSAANAQLPNAVATDAASSACLFKENALGRDAAWGDIEQIS